MKLLLKIMREYLLKQPKATCVLFSIACKINLGLVKNNGNPGGTGGVALALEIRVGGGITVIQEIWVGGGGQKTLPSVGAGVWIFSGITQCHIPR